MLERRATLKATKQGKTHVEMWNTKVRESHKIKQERTKIGEQSEVDWEGDKGINIMKSCDSQGKYRNMKQK